MNRPQGRYDLEHLESRTLLTTLSGTIDANGNIKDGDVFEFRSSAGAEQVIRVKLQGRVTVELIGAQVNRRSNDIQLVNLPGLLNGEPIAGGILTGIGIQPIGPLLVNPVAAPTPPIFNPNVSALAADNNGNIYGFHSGPAQVIDPNTGQTVQGTAVQIVQLTLPAPNAQGQIMGTVLGTVISTIFVPNNTVNPQLPTTVTGADVAPDGSLVFVGQPAGSPAGTIGLFSVNPLLANPATPVDEVAQSLNSFGNIPLPQAPGGGQQQQQTISTIAFVGNQLFGILAAVQQPGGGGGQGQNQLIQIDLATASISSGPFNITVGGTTGGGGGGGGPSPAWTLMKTATSSRSNPAKQRRFC